MGHLRVTPGLFIDALRVHWRLLAIPLIIVPLVSLSARFLIKPKLQASSLLLVQQSQNTNPVLRDMLVETSVKQRIAAVASIVQSSAVLEQVLLELEEITPETDSDVVAVKVATYRAQIAVWGEGGGLVRIKTSGRWTGRVYEGLRIITRILIDEMLRPHTQAPKETVAFLEGQLDRVTGELAEVEARITDVKTATATALPEVRKLVLANYGRVSADRLKAEAELVEARKSVEGMSSTVTAGGRSGDKLARAKATLATLRATYKAAHPEVKAAAATVARFEREAAAAGGSKSSASKTVRKKTKGARVASRDADALQEKVEFLRSQEETLLDSIREQAGNEQQLLTLTRAYDVKSKVYAGLLQRFEDAKVSLSLATLEARNKVRVIDAPPADPKRAPVFSWVILLAGGIIGGLFLGLSGMLVFEFLDSSVRQREEAESLTGVPVLATMPELGGSWS